MAFLSSRFVLFSSQPASLKLNVIFSEELPLNIINQFNSSPSPYSTTLWYSSLFLVFIAHILSYWFVCLCVVCRHLWEYKFHADWDHVCFYCIPTVVHIACHTSNRCLTSTWRNEWTQWADFGSLTGAIILFQWCFYVLSIGEEISPFSCPKLLLTCNFS